MKRDSVKGIVTVASLTGNVSSRDSLFVLIPTLGRSIRRSPAPPTDYSNRLARHPSHDRDSNHLDEQRDSTTHLSIESVKLTIASIVEHLNFEADGNVAKKTL